MRVRDPVALARTLIAVGCFCLLSSTVYLFNDIVDVEKDRAHPTKRKRPIAAGTLSIVAAQRAAVLFAAVALALACGLGLAFVIVALGYLSLNFAYSFLLKRVAFVDVFTIGAGFLLRVLAGAVAIPVPPSGWLLTCTALLASFLGFGKRAHELRTAGISPSAQRAVLERYNATVLRRLLIALALVTLAAYSAYTQSQHAQTVIHARHLALTIPFVAFGLGRFLWLTLRRGDAESPTDAMLSDRWFVLNLALYAATVGLALYRG